MNKKNLRFVVALHIEAKSIISLYNLKKYKILVVKSGYLSPELKKLKADNFMILTDGFVTQDFKRIKNLFREKPIYPFQKNFRYNIAI